MMYGYDHGMAMGWLGMALYWLVPVLLLVGMALLLRRLFGSGRSDGKRALDILEERYARGEIDQDEFRKRRADLGA